MSRRVLVVDDEPHILLILEKVLKKYECDVEKAEDGEIALKLINSNDYDVIILDLMMPGLSGIEVCRHIRANTKLKNKPVVILTADKDDGDRDECLTLGISEYITKPFSPKKIAEKIEEILAKCPKD